MTISCVASVNGTNAAAGVSFTVPAGVQAGDRLVAVVATNSDVYDHVMPPGWQLLDTQKTGSHVSSTITKVAEGTDAGATVVITHTPTGAPKDVGVLAAYRGTDTSPLVDVHGVVGPASGTTIPVPDLVTTQPNAMLVAAAAHKVSMGTADAVWTIPLGATSRGQSTDNGGGGISAVLVDLPQTVAGATDVGDFVIALSDGSAAASGAHNGFLVALYEGEPPPLVAPVFRRYTINGWYPPRD